MLAQASRLTLISGLDPFHRSLLHPGHHRTKSFPDFFDIMLFTGLEQRVVFFVATLVFGDPSFGEFAALNFFERFLHALLHAGINDFWTNADVAPLRSFRNRKTHAANASFVH